MCRFTFYTKILYHHLNLLYHFELKILNGFLHTESSILQQVSCVKFVLHFYLIEGILMRRLSEYAKILYHIRLKFYHITLKRKF
jgi:hypothetical protein